ncbi:Growth factor receptor-bound protein 10 [Halotydeus destructor]|nr:Growth factor receptor-bound protein 10 [Halotydeus destructor]
MHCGQRVPFIIPVTGNQSNQRTSWKLQQATTNRRRLDSADNFSIYSSSFGSTSSDLEDEGNNMADTAMDTSPVTVIFDGQDIEMTAEENLAATDLCHLLVLKLSLEKIASWSLLLRLRSANIERQVEGDEEIAPLCRKYASASPVLELKKNLTSRWPFFETPSTHFQLDMIQLIGQSASQVTPGDRREKLHKLTHQLHFAEQFEATVSSQLKVSDGDLSCPSSKICRPSRPCVATLLGSTLTIDHMDLNCTSLTLDMTECDYFTSSTKENELTISIVDNGQALVHQLFCSSLSQKTCWITCLRIAKHGLKKLRRHAQHFLRQRPSPSPAVSCSGYQEMEGKMYFDYSKAGSQLHEPFESESRFDSIENRRRSRARSSSIDSSPCKSLRTPPNVQPWFYSELNREDAVRLLDKYLSVNGVFLVRNSSRNPGTHVLSFVHAGKINHMMIQRIEDDFLSIDQGRTKFYDLQQLVEFYQLNIGLPVKLSYFVVHSSG